ncbi:RNA polymerase II C-terminal domain phosphatase-like 4 isoform X2 [Rosa chinensis]|uniref:RNA polymerase II C-terminal domain phosphatase-like 4 isoform X2 n=1 Tax=Rosa chinensis TaxID=74649 RepID=UPI000D08AB26|nr:RNA polymerase II C-terminal domain phosphatase-like 4 isoform X2 [Rosa chinensis]
MAKPTLFQENLDVNGNVSFPKASSFQVSKCCSNPNFARALSFNSNSRKLHLVLDLDHTLLHTTQLCNLTPEEDYLKIGTHPHRDVFVLETVITKLRPFVWRFLDEASKMFELYIYTKGNRYYAGLMAALLDPRKEYFPSSSRVISCEDHGIVGRYKSLDAVVGCNYSNVLILDDTEAAWTKESRDNLILVEKYCFFRHKMGLPKCKSYAELKTDECGYLAALLEVLNVINRIFCDELAINPSGVDVRDVLQLFGNNSSRENDSYSNS